LAKGLETSTKMRMTEIIEEIMPGHPAGVLSGPNLAKEIHSGKAAAAVLQVEKRLSTMGGQFAVEPFSSLNYTGVSQMRSQMAEWVESQNS
jgi:glycerol-3-phosphate dehydrogenase